MRPFAGTLHLTCWPFRSSNGSDDLDRRLQLHGLPDFRFLLFLFFFETCMSTFHGCELHDRVVDGSDIIVEAFTSYVRL